MKVGDITTAPDYLFRAGGINRFFVEAKKPAVKLREGVGPACQVRRVVRLATLREGEPAMQPVQRAARAHPRGAWVGLLAVLTLAAMPLLAASALSAPAAQTVQPVSYLPLVQMTPNYRIAYISERDGNAEIYVMNADGSNQTRLTNNLGGDLFPVWSPDGRQIAFVSDRDGNWEIYVMNADGSNQTRLTNSPTYDSRPVWSPDGRQIAFDSAPAAWCCEIYVRCCEIYVMNADGSNQARLADGTNPVWSPR